MNRAAMIATLALGLLAAPPLSAQLTEQGSLRGFLLGSEPAAAYDNWYSHTVEGLSSEQGYNDYIPASIDPQTRGFGSYTLISEAEDAAAREVWIPAFNALLQGNLTTSQMLLRQANLPFDVVQFEDNETGRTFHLIREQLDSTFVDSSGTPEDPADDVHGSFRMGWGLFIVNADASMPSVMAQVPHPNDDYISLPIALELLLRGNIGALIVNGTGREVVWTDSYNNSRSISDPTRYPYHPFNYFCMAFVERMRQLGELDMTIQLHSYDTATHYGSKPVMISSGPADQYPNRPIYDRSGYFLDWINFTPAIPVQANAIYDGQAEVTIGDYYAVAWQDGLHHRETDTEISNYVDLPGYGSNVPMDIVAHGLYAGESVDRFVHMEFDELPGVIQDADVHEDSLYGASIPPDLATWEPMLLYYDAAINGLVEAVENIYLVPDNTAPSDPGRPSLTYASDQFATIVWSISSDPNFHSYEIYYDNQRPVNLSSPKFDSRQIPELANMLTYQAWIEPLEPDEEYQVAIRAIDRAGNVSSLSEPVNLFTRDETDPVIRDAVLFSSFPVDAWPPAFECEVRSMEPLAYVAVDLELNGEDRYSLPLTVSDEWIPGDNITFALSGPHPSPQLHTGDQLRYRYRTRDTSLHTEEVTSAWYEAQLTGGPHFFEADLDHYNGGFQPEGDPGWVWGVPQGGPGSGEDSERAWHILSSVPGTDAILHFPYTFQVEAVEQLYLVMDIWYDTDLIEDSDDVTAGAWLERPFFDRWRTISPIDSYPAWVDTTEDHDTRCFGGNSSGWRQVVFDLEYYIGDPLDLRFHFRSTSSDTGSVGVVIDNIRLTSIVPVLPAPFNVTIRDYDTNGLLINWERNGASLYRIYRGSTPSGPMEMIGEVTGMHYIDSDVLTSGGESFYYRVTAVLR